VSAQDEGSHQKFAEKHHLKFPLLADTDLAIARAYGVAGAGLGGLLRALVKASERVTFIIDENGFILHVIGDPDCPDHGDEVLALLK
jgi:peroxiredoxin Q/BCP